MVINSFKDLMETPKIDKIIKNTSASKLVLVIIRHALEGRASAIHIEPQLNEIQVRFRIDGVLHTSLVLPKYLSSGVITQLKALANLNSQPVAEPQEGRTRLNIDGKNFDFRFSFLPLVEGEKVVLKITDINKKVPTLKDLGFNEIHLEIIKRNLKKNSGLILVAGPTDSGKTATIYSSLSELNEERINVMTLEDPVEYYLSFVNQSEVNSKLGYTYNLGLLAILSQDPDVIMVGEMKDLAVAELIIHSSLNGRLMLSTIAAKNALAALSYLFDLGIESFLLASALNLIIAQRLVRKICPHCKTPVSLPPSLEKQIKLEIENLPPQYLKSQEISAPGVFWKGRGCSRCANTGYLGRLAVLELIEITETIKEVLARRQKSADFLKDLKNQNFITLKQDCLLKVLGGVTTIEELMRIGQF